MQKSKSSAIIITFSVVAIAIMMLKITGIYDITTLLSNSSNSARETVIDEWISEPFGDLGVQISFTSYKDKLIRLTLNSTSEKFDSEDFGWFYEDSGKEMDISKITYNDVWLMSGGHDKETGMVYTGFAVPLDCEKILLDGNEIIPQNASIKTTAGKKEFKVCTLTYLDDNQRNHEFVLIDKGGNEHLIKEDF